MGRNIVLSSSRPMTIWKWKKKKKKKRSPPGHDVPGLRLGTLHRHLLGELDELRDRHALLLEDELRRSRHAERVDALDLVCVLVPDDGDARLDGGGLRLHSSGEDLLDVLRRLTLKRLKARHGDNTGACAELLGRVVGHAELGANANDDALELALLLDEDVAALLGAFPLQGRVHVEDGQVLARQDER